MRRFLLLVYLSIPVSSLICLFFFFFPFSICRAPHHAVFTVKSLFPVFIFPTLPIRSLCVVVFALMLATPAILVLPVSRSAVSFPHVLCCCETLRNVLYLAGRNVGDIYRTRTLSFSLSLSLLPLCPSLHYSFYRTVALCALVLVKKTR